MDLAYEACSFIRSDKKLPVGQGSRDTKGYTTIQPRLHYFSGFQVSGKSHDAMDIF